VRYILLLAITYCCLCPTLTAQTVTLHGTVTDKQTEEAIPFANVFIKGTGIGMATDFEGKYTIQITLPADSLGASSIGYENGFKKISGAAEQVINFQLDRSDYNLQEVVILPGENPAIRIVKNTIDKKKSHDKRTLDSYGYEAYNKIEVDMDDLTDKFKDRKVFKPFKFVFNNIDSTSEEKPFLPFFISETVSDFFHQKTPVDNRETIKASKVSGINNISISQFLGNMYVEIDVYEDWIYLLQRQFISPVSQAGLSTYRYYLVDSQMIDNYWCYKIQFMPKRKGELTFDGDMWIADSVFAIKQISMKMSGDADVNFVKRMSLYNEFTPVKDSVWMLKKEKLIINFIKPKEGPGLIGRKTASYRDFTVNESEATLDSLFKKRKLDVSILDSATLRSDAYWQSVRHDTLSTNEKRVYQMIDTLKNLPIVKSYIDIIQTVYTGYKDVGPFSIGNIFSFVSNNNVEGWRFKYGMSTSNKFSKYVMLGGYAAYGLKDKRVKYGAEFLWLMHKSPRESIAISYRNDLSSTSNYNVFYGNAGLLANFGVRRVEEGKYIPQKLVGVKELKADFYKEFNVGYSFKIGFVNRQLQPLGAFSFKYHNSYDDGRPNTDVNSVTATEFTITNRFAWQEKFVSGEFNRLSLGSDYPILFLQWGIGIKGLMKGDYEYYRVVFGISDNQPLGPLGKLYWNVETGRTWGRLPFLMLNMPDVSESYIYNWSGFNTLRDYDFVADRYVKVLIDHHLGGILFNRIPGIRKLKIREVWSARMWWGSLTKDNYSANRDNMADNPGNTGLVQLKTPSKVPLVEISAGIENILRVIRIDAVWRVTHVDKRGSPFSFRYGNFGVRIGLQLQF
jgi:hypothetical protein